MIINKVKTFSEWFTMQLSVDISLVFIVNLSHFLWALISGCWCKKKKERFINDKYCILIDY